MIDYPLITARAAERIARRQDDCIFFGLLVTKTRPDCSTVWPDNALLPIRVQQSGERF